MFKGQVKRTENWATVRKPKDRRNGQFSGVERRYLNPAPSFLLLFCGKKVEIKIFGPTIPNPQTWPKWLLRWVHKPRVR